MLAATLVMGMLAPAGAADGGPSAVDDAFTFQKSVAFDALSNDTAASGLPRIVSNTQPANGTASCNASGACFYTANPGFTGSDSFKYTITDDTGLTSEANVALTVNAAVAGSLTAVEDNLATKSGAAGNVDVLANDVGGSGPKTVTSSSTPSHGTASCDPGGVCTYTPNAGFAGTDGFNYTASDGSSSASSVVHVVVAPTDAAFALVAGGNPAPNGANWLVGAKPTDVPQEASAAVGVPGLNGSTEAPQAIVAGSAGTAPGWALGSVTSSDAHATPTNAALTGDSLNALFPPPLPPISQGTGGDGHVPIKVGSKVFAFFHHTYPTQVTCVDRQTGSVCPGYPKPVNVSGSPYLGASVVVGTQFWTHLYTTSPNSPFSFAQTASIGLYCWDAATDSTCGLTIVDRVMTTQQPQVSPPQLVGGRMWFGGETGQLYCVDPTNGAVCPPIPMDLGTLPTFHGDNNEPYDSVSHGSRVYLSRFDDHMVTCVDVVARANCAGWPAPTALADTHDLINRYNSTGQADGVCEASQSNTLVCVPDGDSTAKATLNGWVSGDVYYSSYEEAETGSRTIYGSLSYGGVSCYDWTTQAACTGGQYSGGRLAVDKDGNGLPSAYGTVFDGACVVGLGDPGRVFTVDPAGISPCTSLATGTAGKVIDLRSQRCDNSVGQATWGRVAILDANLVPESGDFDSLVVTVKDATTGQVLASKEMVDSNGLLDLSGIDPAAHPALSIGANAISRAGSQAWASGNWPKANISWHADPAGLCFTSAAPVICDTPATTAAMNAAFADGSAATRVTVPVAATDPCRTPEPPQAVVPPTPLPNLPPYTMVAQDGGVFAPGGGFFGTAQIRTPDPVVHGPDGTGFLSPLFRTLPAPVVGMAYDSTGNGYWLATADGVVYPVGDAPDLGDIHAVNQRPRLVAIAATPDRLGYYLFGADGSVFCFGHATCVGSLSGMHLNAPIVGGAADPDGDGYYMVASDGGVFAFNAPFLGSMGGVRLSRPVVGMAVEPNGGYLLAGSDGGVFTFGGAAFEGSLPGIGVRPNSPIVGIAADPDGDGYWMAGADGGAFAFNAVFTGSVVNLLLNAPMTGIVSR